MKLIFNSITLGGGPHYFLEQPKGLKGDLENIDIKVPRTDYSKDINDLLTRKVRTFSGTIVGADSFDYKEKRRALANMLRKTFVFQLVDDIKNNDGTYSTFATYEFTGKIIDFDPDNEVISNSSKFILQIYCSDPLLYLLPEVEEEINITNAGFTFPMTFPFVFTGLNNTITVQNDGLYDVYPTIEIFGAGTNFTIINQSSDLVNKEFKYNATLNDGESVVITPIPTDSIKIRKNGISVIQQTNSNWDVLKLKPGANIFTFLVESNNNSNTKATITFKSAFLGI